MIIALIVLGLGATTMMATPAAATEIRAMITGAMTGAMRDLQPAYEQATGNKLVISWGPSSGSSKDAIPVRLANGETPDVLIMIGPSLDKLVADGKFAAGSKVDLARSLVGVAVKAGAPKPDASTPEALRDALLAAKSIGYSEGGSGVYVSTQLLGKLGIADEVAPKMKKITGELVGEAVARGEVEICMQQVSELKAVAGVTYLGPLPKAVENVAIFAVAVSAKAKDAAAAKSFVDFLTSREGAAAIEKSGLEPIEGK
jgi:molybdate transport system substrate-binding protein